MSLMDYLQENWAAVLHALLIHVQMSLLSILFAVLIAVPIGILLTRHEKAAKVALAGAGVIQTIPGLVMLGIGLLLFGLGMLPSVIVLVAYAILPIMQNTFTGIKEVDGLYTEAAKGIGMTDFQILLKVEFPIAIPAIVAGIRLSLVYIISWATLAALITEAGLDAAEVQRLAADPRWLERRDADTRAALDRGVFGAPCYVIGEDIFWGQDRLDFVARRLARG